MHIAVQFAIALEVVAVSLSVTDMCLHRKYPALKVLLALTLFSFAEVALGYGVLHQMPLLGCGSGLFILLCLLFMCPVCFLYKESFSCFLTVLSFSWVYSMLIFSLSVHIAKLFFHADFYILVLALQSCVYASSIYWFSRFIRHKFLYLLNHVSSGLRRYFLLISAIWSILILVLNLAFQYSETGWLKAGVLIILTGNIMLSYVMLFRLVRNMRDINHLQQVIYIDEMTGLDNRSRMFMDTACKMREKQPFYLIYIDLNEFKCINDSYGHLAGDEYLCKAAAAIREIIGRQGSLYRMSGDEFIGIYTGGDISRCLKQMKEFPWEEIMADMEFRGFSVGYARYPDDSRELDTLIHMADSRMYLHKRNGNAECT